MKNIRPGIIHIVCAILYGTFVWSGLAAGLQKPDVIFILADDMGTGDPGCYGGRQTPTPNIDQLAKEGIRFTRYYSASPICSPSRVGLFTGMFPARWRITSYLHDRKGNRESEQADFLDSSAPSLARQFKEAGYVTGHFGKWHMGGGRDVTDAPKFSAYGFDENAGTWESPEPHPDITGGNWIWSPKDKIKRRDRTAFFVDKTLDFLKRHRDQPCFVQVWPDDVHTPWVPDDHPAKGDSAANFRPVLGEFDRQLGRLFEGLRELGKNTIVVFASDNGALPTFNGERASGLRGSKLSLYEGGIRLPFIVWWPGHIPAGKVDNTTVVGGVDLLPSLCALAGIPLPKEAKLDGEDLSGAFLGTASTARTHPLFWEYGRNPTAFKYPSGRDRSPNVAVQDGRWKLLLNADGSGVELYDLSTDPGEKENIASAHPEVAKKMTASALEWRKSLP